MKKNQKRKVAAGKLAAANSPGRTPSRLREPDAATARAAVQNRFKRSGADRLWRHAAAEGRRRQARRDAK